MQIWQAVVLGAVQGLAEFLPISSSGHLILLQHWFGIKEGLLFFSVMLHIGTLIPVIIVLWKDILGLFRPINNFLLLVLATVPAGIVGLIIHFTVDIDAFFTENIYLIGITFLFTAAELLFAEVYSKKKCKVSEFNNPITVKTSLVMGLGQAVGVFPGISRSGSTTSFGALKKVDRKLNASFTFLMSIPIILAAVFLESLDVIKNGVNNVDVIPLLFGVISSAVCGYIAINFMLKLIKKANYKWFSLYLALLSVAVFISYGVGV